MDQVEGKNRATNIVIDQLIESMSNFIDIIRDMNLETKRLEDRIEALEQENKNT